MLSDEEIINLNASGDVSAVVTATGQIYTWGRTKVCIEVIEKCLGRKSRGRELRASTHYKSSTTYITLGRRSLVQVGCLWEDT